MSPEHDESRSKSERKRQAETLQDLGEELAELPEEVLDILGLPDRLRQALVDLSAIPSHEAQRRHRQFIGRLMRDVDAGPLQAFVDARKRPSREAARLFRITEQWRDRLLDQGDAALQAFTATYPGVDTVTLNETVVAAREGRSGAPKRLFRMIRATVDQHAASGGALLE